MASGGSRSCLRVCWVLRAMSSKNPPFQCPTVMKRFFSDKQGREKEQAVREQMLRAALFQDHQWCSVLTATGLTPDAVAHKVPGQPGTAMRQPLSALRSE